MNVRASMLTALAGACLAAVVSVAAVGWSADPVARVLQTAGVAGALVIVLGAIVAFVTDRLTDYHEARSEDEFDRIVERSERLASEGLAVDPDEGEFLAPDPYDDDDFGRLVADAMDDLPDLLRGVLDHNVAVVISDEGRRHQAYGLYVGDGIARDDVPDRVLVFRDTLRRDFGHDPDELREQVVITVRHELAHHVGFDELGVRDLGL